MHLRLSIQFLHIAKFPFLNPRHLLSLVNDLATRLYCILQRKFVYYLHTGAHYVINLSDRSKVEMPIYLLAEIWLPNN